MTLNEDSIKFYSNLSKIWQNYKDYSYFKGINLSPEQINIINTESEQLLIEGYAGTGKSLTLIYKFINTLIRENNKKILFVTYNQTLIEDTQKRLDMSGEYKRNVDKHYVRIATFHQIASEILRDKKIITKTIGKMNADKIKYFKDTQYRRIGAILAHYTDKNYKKYRTLNKSECLYRTHDVAFVTEEIAWIKAMGFISRERYLVTDRIGRSKSIRLTRMQRNTIFSIYEEYENQLHTKFGAAMDLEDYALYLLENMYLLDDSKFDYIFVDEFQDLDPMQIKALCMLTKKSIVISGDAKQKIYKKTPFKWEELGLEINQKGKRKVLFKNYRSTKEIVKIANSLKFLDDENKLSEKQFVRSGEKPKIYKYPKPEKAIDFIVKEIKSIYDEDEKKTIAIIHREEIKKNSGSKSGFRLRLEEKLKNSIIDIDTYGKRFEFENDKQVVYTNVYDVKGLEFDVVFIIDFTTKYYPNQAEIEKIKFDNEDKDEQLVEQDINDFINREKKLLYVAMTRAKDKLYLIANGFTDDKYISKFILDFDPSLYDANFAKTKIYLDAQRHGNKKEFIYTDKIV